MDVRGHDGVHCEGRVRLWLVSFHSRNWGDLVGRDKAAKLPARSHIPFLQVRKNVTLVGQSARIRVHDSKTLPWREVLLPLLSCPKITLGSVRGYE